MSDISFLVQASVVIAATVLPIILIIRLIAGEADGLERPRLLPEPEPPRWNVAPAM